MGKELDINSKLNLIMGEIEDISKKTKSLANICEQLKFEAEATHNTTDNLPITSKIMERYTQDMPSYARKIFFKDNKKGRANSFGHFVAAINNRIGLTHKCDNPKVCRHEFRGKYLTEMTNDEMEILFNVLDAIMPAIRNGIAQVERYKKEMSNHD
jgi:hypothetical protein